MATIDPNDFIISRKRKKYRFALFHNSPLCFEFDEWNRENHVDSLEVGAGNGLFSVELAERYPEQNFAALDVKADRLQHGARRAEALGLTNIKFVRARADQIGSLFPEASLGQIWLTFPDPFPKNRSSGRRLTHPNFLNIYEQLLRENGELRFKHDDPEFFKWSLEQIVASAWQIKQLSFDLHESDLPGDYKILTTYEKRWLGENKPTQFVAARANIKL